MAYHKSEYLICKDFGFSLPSDLLSIDGITVECEAGSNLGGSASSFTGTLFDPAGNFYGSGHSFSLSLATDSGEQYRSIGGSNQLIDFNGTYSDINDSGFGVGIEVTSNVEGQQVDVFVDHVRITVDYTDADNNPQTAGPLSPSSTTSNAKGETDRVNAWSDPNNAQSSNDSHTTTSAYLDVEPTPGTAALTLTTYAPVVTVSGGGGYRNARHQGPYAHDVRANSCRDEPCHARHCCANSDHIRSNCQHAGRLHPSHAIADAHPFRARAEFVHLAGDSTPRAHDVAAANQRAGHDADFAIWIAAVALAKAEEFVSRLDAVAASCTQTGRRATLNTFASPGIGSACWPLA